jgi:hypothetical protein
MSDLEDTYPWFEYYDGNEGTPDLPDVTQEES